MSKKKTHEEYVEELKVKNPTVEVVDQYTGANNPILHHCLIHGICWYTTRSRALMGSGCPQCKKVKLSQQTSKSHEQYVKDVSLINPDIVVVGKYVNAKTKIAHYCKKHNICWDAYPESILHCCGCKECCREKIRNKSRKVHTQYVDEVSKVNPNIEVLGVYVNSKTPILHRCKEHEVVWSTIPNNILNRYGCPMCGGNIKKTHDQYVNEVSTINQSIEVIGTYINAKTPIAHRCKIDGHIWYSSPYVMLRGSGCPKCARNAKKTHIDYVQELKSVNPNIRVLEEYCGANTKILHKCDIDGYEWFATPANILFGCGCPKCQSSKGEKQIAQWLQTKNITYIQQKIFANCKDKNGLPFDFYIPEYNLCIEYDGEQHFKPIDFSGKGEEWAFNKFSITQAHDNIKNQYCKDNNIRLLRIPYFKNIESELETFFIHLI